jgi:hypothetical protein
MAKEQTASEVLPSSKWTGRWRKGALEGLTCRCTGREVPLTRGSRARRLCICRPEAAALRLAFPPTRFRPRLRTEEKARTAAIESPIKEFLECHCKNI